MCYKINITIFDIFMITVINKLILKRSYSYPWLSCAHFPVRQPRYSNLLQSQEKLKHFQKPYDGLSPKLIKKLQIL